MKYVSIDIETTGLNPETSQVLSIGAILEDTNNRLSFREVPKFHAGIVRRDINGDLYAVNMNKDLIEKICNFAGLKTEEEKAKYSEEHTMSFFEEDEIVQQFYWWLYSNFREAFQNPVTTVTNHEEYGAVPYVNNKNVEKVVITVAGKNFGTFDKLFLEKLPRWKQLVKVRSRIIDPAVMFTDWETDDAPPGLSECKKRAGLPQHVSHDAVEDAWDVVELIRKSIDEKTSRN